MAESVVIGCAEQSLAYELRSQLAEIGDLEVVGLAATTHELASLVVANDPNVVLVHDQLGPESLHQVVRDLGHRRPASVSVVVSSDPDPEVLAAAMDAGARGVLTYPLTFEAVQQRVTGALEWSRHMQKLLVTSVDGGDEGVGGRGLVASVTGSKGGVGTTTLLTHLAWDLQRSNADLRVVVVDLDLEKGDVTSCLAASYRTSIADLAKVSEDLSPSTVADAVVAHDSGVHLLLPPDDVRDVEWVTPAAVREIVSLLRQQYDLVLIDAGSHVTPVQAAAVEISDEIVQVVTPDLVSLRGLRRDVTWWESLGVAKPEDVKVLLNRTTRSDELQGAAVAQLAASPVLKTSIPHQVKRLESATNSRAPQLVDGDEWWKCLRALADELRLDRVLRSRDVQGVPAADGAPKRRRRGRGERGQASLELLGVVPVVALLAGIMVQLALAGLTFVYTGYAASGAAREVALAPDQAHLARQVADERFPDGLERGLDVRVGPVGTGSADVSVSAGVPQLLPGLFPQDWRISVDRRVVLEG